MRVGVGPILDFDQRQLYYDQRTFDERIADSKPHPRSAEFRRNWERYTDPCTYKSALRWCPECGALLHGAGCRWCTTRKPVWDENGKWLPGADGQRRLW